MGCRAALAGIQRADPTAMPLAPWDVRSEPMIQYKNFVIECAVESQNGFYQSRIFISMLDDGNPVNGFAFPPYPGASIQTETLARKGAEQWAREWIDENF
jgi:hypothetical protein